MKGQGPRKITDLLAGGSLSRIATEARSRRTLVLEVRAAVAAEEADHVVSAHIDESDRLVVGMDSSAWAARLRYEKSELLGRRLKVHVVAPGSMSSGEPGGRSVDDGG